MEQAEWFTALKKTGKTAVFVSFTRTTSFLVQGSLSRSNGGLSAPGLTDTFRRKRTMTAVSGRDRL